MYLKNEQFRLLQRLGGASVLLLALVSLLNLIADQFVTGAANIDGPAEPYLAYLQANSSQWQFNLLWAIAALLAIVGVEAAASRLAPFQPVWAGLARTWGVAALLLSALFDLFEGLPYYFAQVMSAERLSLWLSARMAFVQVQTALWQGQTLLLILLGLCLGMAARKGGLSKLTCYLSFGFGGLYFLLFLLGPGLLLHQLPVLSWLNALAPFLQLLWLILAGVELIRFPDSAAEAAKAA